MKKPAVVAGSPVLSMSSVPYWANRAPGGKAGWVILERSQDLETTSADNIRQGRIIWYFFLCPRSAAHKLGRGGGGVRRVIKSAQKSKEPEELYATPVDPGSETSGKCRPEAQLAALRAQGSKKLISFRQYGRERTEQAVTSLRTSSIFCSSPLIKNLS